MIGKSTKFFSRRAKQMQIICKPHFFSFFQGNRLHTHEPCLITLQNYEGMKALYDLHIRNLRQFVKLTTAINVMNVFFIICPFFLCYTFCYRYR